MPSMPDLSKIKVSISNGFETLSNKSEDFIEISKLKYKIHSEESSMEDLCFQRNQDRPSIENAGVGNLTSQCYQSFQCSDLVLPYLLY